MGGAFLWEHLYWANLEKGSRWEFFISLGIQFNLGSRPKVSKCERTSKSPQGLLNTGSWASPPKALTYRVGIVP